MKAIQVKQPGGPEALEFVDLPIPQPKSREAVVKIAASGVNFIDVNFRESRYKVPLPFVVGQEAAGGVGLLLVQMAHQLGARVIGAVSTEEKAQLARQAVADEVILYTQTDFEAETKRLTGGKGVDVVYDGVGKATFEKSLNVLRPRGMLVLFGASSGPVPPIDPMTLSQKGSLYMARTKLAHFTATRDELL